MEALSMAWQLIWAFAGMWVALMLVSALTMQPFIFALIVVSELHSPRGRARLRRRIAALRRPGMLRTTAMYALWAAVSLPTTTINGGFAPRPPRRQRRQN